MFRSTAWPVVAKATDWRKLPWETLGFVADTTTGGSSTVVRLVISSTLFLHNIDDELEQDHS
jgi:hypothetical protein